MKAALYPNFQKTNALSCAREACDVLADCGIDVSVSEIFRNDFSDKPHVSFEDINEAVKTADVVLAIGGDGTILRCSSYTSRYDKPILGINCGTLGFMASLEPENIDRLRLLCTGEYKIVEAGVPDGYLDSGYTTTVWIK